MPADQHQWGWIVNEQREDGIVDIARHHDDAVDVVAAQDALVEVLLHLGSDRREHQDVAVAVAGFGDALDDLREEGIREDEAGAAGNEQADGVGATAGEAAGGGARRVVVLLDDLQDAGADGGSDAGVVVEDAGDRGARDGGEFGDLFDGQASHPRILLSVGTAPNVAILLGLAAPACQVLAVPGSLGALPTSGG